MSVLSEIGKVVTVNPIGAPLRAIKAVGGEARRMAGDLNAVRKDIVTRQKKLREGEPITREYVEIANRVVPDAMKEIASEHRQAAVWLLACFFGALSAIAVSLSFGYLFAIPAIFPAMTIYMMSARRAWLSYIVTVNADCRFNAFLIRYGWGKYAIFGE